jgi:coenzyme F420-reducing hydrogenase gamma subunit
VNALKYLQPLEDARSYIYGERAGWYDTSEVRPAEAVIRVDFAIPGCPIDRGEFIECVKALLLGKKPPIPDYPLCVECKLDENACLYTLGKVCLGPVTRAGCGAICPRYGHGCEACRGFVPNPNRSAMAEVLSKHGLSAEEVTSQYTLFNTYALREVWADCDDKRRPPRGEAP